jgi:hypothetical protein
MTSLRAAIESLQGQLKSIEKEHKAGEHYEDSEDGRRYK